MMEKLGIYECSPEDFSLCAFSFLSHLAHPYDFDAPTETLPANHPVDSWQAQRHWANLEYVKAQMAAATPKHRIEVDRSGLCEISPGGGRGVRLNCN